MRVHVDRTKCCGAGSCVRTAPEVFDQNEEDGLVVVIDSDPPEALRSSVREAADICPNGVISIEQMQRTSA
ncbi:ferredoxin [Streptomyces sp. NPDC051987]|uniref:ferredoxin n=1 Tax=Streptomyces sp. NPDC051987 TaxID=3155808 RepID=UPI00343AFF80